MAGRVAGNWDRRRFEALRVMGVSSCKVGLLQTTKQSATLSFQQFNVLVRRA
jgi:hypothetical protein